MAWRRSAGGSGAASAVCRGAARPGPGACIFRAARAGIRSAAAGSGPSARVLRAARAGPDPARAGRSHGGPGPSGSSSGIRTALYAAGSVRTAGRVRPAGATAAGGRGCSSRRRSTGGGPRAARATRDGGPGVLCADPGWGAC